MAPFPIDEHILSEYKHEIEAGLYPVGAACGNCNHRHPSGVAVAGFEQRQKQSEMRDLREQSKADQFGYAPVRGDHNDATPAITNSAAPDTLTDYELFIRSYVNLSSVPSPQDMLFACPADTFYYAGPTGTERFPEAGHLQLIYKYSSYGFNAGNMRTGQHYPGIAGWKLSSIRDPAKTVLVTELPAFDPYSWHQPEAPYKKLLPPFFNNALNNVGFVDGHVNYTRIYWDTNYVLWTHGSAWQYDPPAGYDYKWSGN